MKGSWAKSRHVSRNSCALFLRSRAVLSPQTQQPHPRRQGEGGVGEMRPPRPLGSKGVRRRKERGGSPRRESDTVQWERDVPSQWSGGAEEAGHRKERAPDRCLRARRGRIRSEDRHRRGRRRDDRRCCRAAWDGSCRRDARRPDGLRGARAVWHRRRC